MPTKPSVIVDLLVTAWIVFVAVMYYGGYVSPAIGAFTGIAGSLYAVVLLVAVAVLALGPVARAQEKKDKKELRWGTDPTGGAPYVYKDDKGGWPQADNSLSGKINP